MIIVGYNKKDEYIFLPIFFIVFILKSIAVLKKTDHH